MNWNMLCQNKGRFISRINFTDHFSGAPCLQRWKLGALARLVLSGCASVSPQRVKTDHIGLWAGAGGFLEASDADECGEDAR